MWRERQYQSSDIKDGRWGFIRGRFESLKQAKCIWVGAGGNCAQPSLSQSLPSSFSGSDANLNLRKTERPQNGFPRTTGKFWLPKDIGYFLKTPACQIKAPSSTLPQQPGTFLHRTYHNLSINVFCYLFNICILY